MENIIEKINRLIADFDGLRKGTDTFLGGGEYPCYYDDAGRHRDSRNSIPYSSLTYHKSWDWLMPVVRKITDILLGGLWGTNDNIIEQYYYPIRNALLDVNIKETFEAVGKAIEWHNNSTNS